MVNRSRVGGWVDGLCGFCCGWWVAYDNARLID